MCAFVRGDRKQSVKVGTKELAPRLEEITVMDKFCDRT